ncbi:MAG: hypothetical protein FRX49_13290 [Trebouxia sp. A1-2]|nr:MAG: hypothetical protein FRX49_13290 [Trebouxia sp. A1-2]
MTASYLAAASGLKAAPGALSAAAGPSPFRGITSMRGRKGGEGGSSGLEAGQMKGQLNIETKGKFRGQEGQTKWAWTKSKWQRAKYLHKAAALFIFRNSKQQALQASKMMIKENSILQKAKAVVRSNTHPPQPSQPRVVTLECLASAS